MLSVIILSHKVPFSVYTFFLLFLVVENPVVYPCIPHLLDHHVRMHFSHQIKVNVIFDLQLEKLESVLNSSLSWEQKSPGNQCKMFVYTLLQLGGPCTYQLFHQIYALRKIPTCIQLLSYPLEE